MQTPFTFDNLIIHLLPAIFSAGGAWMAVRYELRSLKRVTKFLVAVVVDLVETHNKNHPESRISLGELGKAFFSEDKVIL